MPETFMPSFQNLDALHEYQMNGLKWTLEHVYRGSTFYHDRFQNAGVTPKDISSLEDIRHLPFTTADDLRSGYPFPLLSVPESEVVRIHASSGTTGKKKVLSYTRKDISDWGRMFARCYEMAGVTTADRVQIAVGYGIW
ncbi:MAG: phenylacetate--CoA ligase family protein, partial [Thermodesulfobacteriota bacterium]